MQFHESGSLSFVRALVTDNKDPEQLGRVKVKYPSFSGNASQLASDWARLCQSYASSTNGEWFLPDVGDEVLVAFEGPNLDHPIILGSLYGSKNKPPTSGLAGDFNSDGKNNLKFIKSRSGNLIAFNDAAGEEGVRAKDKQGAELRLAKGKVALGTSKAELLDLLVQVLDVISQNAPTMVSTAVGPGVLNASVLKKIDEVKQKIGEMKGTLD